ncbi:MAG: tetratricopeptide repeat protein, partial [Anaerolineales bacterium]|nr:tetratricopeptide repeat protein [Anaerolineales bacterium]
QLAHYLEYTYPDHPPVEVLAFHYGHSENTAKQREYFRKAGDAAQRNYANTAALDFYSKLLPLLEDAQEQAQVRWQKGQVLNLLGRWDEAEEDFRAVLGLSEDNLALRADAQFAMGNLTRQRSDFQVALTWLAEAKANRTALADTSGLMHVILETGATFLNMHLAREKGAAESAQVLLEEGLALARQQDDKPSMAYALNHLGSLAGMKGDYATVEVLYQESMAIRRELGDKKGLAVMLGNLGNIAKKQGDFLKARGLYLECSRLFREVGEKRSIAMVLINLGLLTFEQGDYAHAQALCEESLTLFREMGDKQTIAFALMGLGDVLAIQGNYAAARVAFEESLGLGANFSYYPLGRVVLAQGEYALAQTNFEKSLEFSRGTNAKKSIVLSLIGLGHLALVQNNATAAREWFEEALALNKENESKANLAATLLGLGLLALAEKNGEAYPHMLESLRLYQETESRPQQTSSLLGVAGVVFQRGDARRAAQLLGAVETALKALTIVIEPEMFHFHAQLMEKVRTGLGESAFQAAWNEGSQWSLEEAVRFALAEETK